MIPYSEAIEQSTEEKPKIYTIKVVFPLAYAWGTFLLVQKFQGEQIKEHFAAGGKTYTIWRALLAGLICLVVTLAVIVVILLMIPGALGE